MIKINFHQLNINQQKASQQTPAEAQQQEHISKQNILIPQLTHVENVEQTMIDLLQTSISHIAKKDKMTETNRSFIFDEESRMRQSSSKDKPIGSDLKKIKQQIIVSMSELSESRENIQKKQYNKKQREYGKIMKKQSPIKIEIQRNAIKQVGFIVTQHKPQYQNKNNIINNIINNSNNNQSDKMKEYISELKQMGNKKNNSNIKPFKLNFEEQEIEKKHEKDLVKYFNLLNQIELEQQKAKLKNIYVAPKKKKQKEYQTPDPKPVLQVQPKRVLQPYRKTPAIVKNKLYQSVANNKTLQDIYIQRLTNKLFMKNKTLTIQPNTLSRLVQQQFQILYPFLHNAEIQQKPLTKSQFKRSFLSYYLNLSTDKRRLLKSIHQREYQSVMDSIK